MVGEPTTAGCRAVADRAVPAERDAACLNGAREAGARIVGRTNLHELALGVTGVNQWYGTPVNPLDPSRVPGGSSSGSAVAVATGEADVAYGSDTGGSVRIPAACCGIAGPQDHLGPHPARRRLAPGAELRHRRPDGPHRGGAGHGHAAARAGLRRGGPGRSRPSSWAASRSTPTRRSPPRSTGPWARWVGTVGEWRVPGWDDATMQAGLLLVVEAWHADGALVAQDPAGISDAVRERLELGGLLRRGRPWQERGVRSVHGRRRSSSVFTEVDLLITPTLSIFPPHLDDGDDLLVSRCTLPVNLAGRARPVAPRADRRPAARQRAADRAAHSARSGSWPRPRP